MFRSFPLHLCFAITVTLFTYSRQYEVGTTYSFVYETSVLLNEPLKIPVSSPKDVGFKVDLKVEVSPVWQKNSNSMEQLLELKVTIPKLSVKSRHGPTPTSFVNKPSRADGLKTYPFFILREQGLVKKVFYSEREELSVVNIKKGIASLFQYQLKEGPQDEQDASGSCTVIYEEIDKIHWVKTKTSCRGVNEVPQFNHTNKVLGALIENQSATTLELDPDDYSIQIASSVETHFLRPGIRQKIGAEVVGRQLLQLTGKSKHGGKLYTSSSINEAVKEISKNVGESLLSDPLYTIPDPKECIYCKSLKELIGNFRSALKESNLATQASCIAFIRLLRKMRESDAETIRGVLTDKRNAKIFPQLIDIAAATQTVYSHDAAKKVLDFKGQIDLPERYLLGLAVNTHPVDSVIEDLLSLAKKGVKNQKLYETLVLSLSSMARTLAKRHPIQNKVVSDVEYFLMSKLEKCKEESCKLIYIRALENFKSRSSLVPLMKFARSKSKNLAIYAINAIETFPTEMFDQTIMNSLEKIAFELDAPHDSSVRLVAIDILLNHNPQEDIIKDLFELLKRSKTREFNTLLLNYISSFSEKDLRIKQIVDGLLLNCSLVNYNTLSQGGSSSAFTRSLAEDETVSSFFTNKLEINGGLLKRSTVDVIVKLDDDDIKLLSFGVFAGGLSLFGSEAEETDDEEANAGIEVSILESQLRPFILFSGQGELMGHVWSGTGSERTTALQGSVLLQDHSQIVPLQNGINAEMLLTGVASCDFAGQVQISLWNRNSHSLVEVGAAMVLQGQIRVDNLFVQTMIEYNIGGQTQLDLTSDLNFSGEIAMCMQMSQPEFEVIHNVRKLERIPGSNYALRKYKKRKSPLSGKTYVINRKNTEFCNKMFRN